MKTILEARDLCKTYIVDKRQNNVLKNINFSVKEGEMVAIMGPSGSGKSTLLYTVSGMDDATGGDVFFEDKNIAKLDGNELAALRLDEMGFIFQQMYMMKNLTILDNIVLPAMQSKKTKETKKEKMQRGEALMRKLGIIEIADNDINEVSGGQLQRACICRSMINKPRLLFTDEPTGALNRTSSDEVMEELVKLNREGTTIMMVTHDAKVAEKSRFFGKFLWGMEMLRENLEEDKEKELALHREKKTLILSLSHDIKTPLSAIKLYTKALIEELYDSREKREEALRGIADNTLGIEGYVNEIVAASREDFLNLEVNNGEFYLSEAMQDIQRYYKDKLSLQHTEFVMEGMTDCLVKGDKERVIEVLQNIMENAIKYGDGRQITIAFSEEEDCRLVSVVNTGSSIPESELVHIFDSFYRGSNADHVKGSGLGLYICRSLMHRMDGEVFAEQHEDGFLVTVVIRKAG